MATSPAPAVDLDKKVSEFLTLDGGWDLSNVCSFLPSAVCNMIKGIAPSHQGMGDDHFSA